MNGNTMTIIVLAIIAIGGIYLGLFGRKGSKLVSILVAFSAAVAVVSLISYAFSLGTLSIIPFIAIGLGSIASVLVFFFPVVLFPASGIICFSILIPTILYLVNILIHYAIPENIFSILCLAISVIFGIGFGFLRKKALLFTTSFAGGFLTAFPIMLAILIALTPSIVITSPLSSLSGWIHSIIAAFKDYDTVLELIILAIYLLTSLFYWLVQSEIQRHRQRKRVQAVKNQAALAKKKARPSQKLDLPNEKQSKFSREIEVYPLDNTPSVFDYSEIRSIGREDPSSHKTIQSKEERPSKQERATDTSIIEKSFNYKDSDVAGAVPSSNMQKHFAPRKSLSDVAKLHRK